MTRRWFLGLVLTGILCATDAPRAAAADKPNFLFILSDDQRFDTIRALGNDEIQTPNLDKLVQRGFSFSNAYCMGGLVARRLHAEPHHAADRPIALPHPRQRLDAQELGRPDAADRLRRRRLRHVPRRQARQLLSAGAPSLRQDDQHPRRTPRTPASVRGRRHRLPAGTQGRPAVLRLPGPAGAARSARGTAEVHGDVRPGQDHAAEEFHARHPFDNGDLEVRDEMLAAVPRSPKICAATSRTTTLASPASIITSAGSSTALQEKGELDNTVIVFSSDHGLAVGGRHGLMGKQNLYEDNQIAADPRRPRHRARGSRTRWSTCTTCLPTAVRPGRRHHPQGSGGREPGAGHEGNETAGARRTCSRPTVTASAWPATSAGS